MRRGGDHLYFMEQKPRRADAVIVSAPTYSMMPPGIIIRFLNRLHGTGDYTGVVEKGVSRSFPRWIHDGPQGSPFALARWNQRTSNSGGSHSRLAVWIILALQRHLPEGKAILPVSRLSTNCADTIEYYYFTIGPFDGNFKTGEIIEGKELFCMKIMLANIGVSEKDGVFVKEMMAPTWKKNLDLVRRPDTEIVLRSSQWGVLGMEGLMHPAIDTLNTQLIFTLCRNAQAEGFDAILITCFGDPMLQQVRAWVDIPVLSIGEACLHTATLMGRKFGIVHVAETVAQECRRQVEEYGFEKNLAGIIPTPETAQEQVEALVDAHSTIKVFQSLGRKLIDMGAEVLIPACGLMAPALRVAPKCEDEYPNGLTEVDGAPIMDVLGVGLKYAEMMVDLKQAGSPWISRRGNYALPTQAMIDSGHMVLEDPRITYWDLPLT